MIVLGPFMREMQSAKTLADYFELTKVHISGASDDMAPRRARWAALVIDGRPLGEYEVGVPRDKNADKHFVEMQWLAIVLVACDFDLEIREIRSLPEESDATPDFEATLQDGSVVRIELTRLSDEREKRYVGAIRGIYLAVNRALERGKPDSITGGGEFWLRFYGAPAVTAVDIPNAARELYDFIVNDPRLRPVSRILHPAPPAYPTLYRLGVHVCHSDSDGTTRVQIQPSLLEADRKAVTNSLRERHKEKADKQPVYARDGHPIWLACYVDTALFYPVGVIHDLSQVDSFDPRPFDQVIVGCPNAGIVFEHPNSPPRYVSLASTD